MKRLSIAFSRAMLVTSLKDSKQDCKTDVEPFPRFDSSGDLERPKSSTTTINVARDAASIQLETGGRGLSHWFHGPRSSFAIFQTACSPERLISWHTLGSISLSLLSTFSSDSFSLSLPACNVLSVAPVHYPIRSRSSGITLLCRTTDLWPPFARLFIIIRLFIAAVSPASEDPIVLQ